MDYVVERANNLEYKCSLPCTNLLKNKPRLRFALLPNGSRGNEKVALLSNQQ